MALRQEDVQVNIAFITDESRKLAQALNTTKQYNQELAQSQAKIQQYNKELAQTNIAEARRTELLRKVAEEEKKMSANLAQIAAEGKKVQALDLSKVTPAQLVERAKQLGLAMRQIPQSAPQFKELEAELARVNGQLAILRANAKGIQDAGPAESGGGFFGSVVGRVTVAIAAVQAFFATVQGLFNFARTAVAEFRAGAAAEAALASRIESTEGAAGRTVEQLVEQAKELQKVTFFTDEQTAKGQEILLTFTNIRGEIFDRTIPAAQDLSTVFGQDLQASAVQLGKALNDPVQGITALRRVGISFSDDQRRMIERLVETNKVAEAQALILTEVERQVGGAARAAAEAEGGPYRLMQQRLGEVQEGFGELISIGLNRLQPMFEAVTTVLEKVVDSLLSGTTATGEYSGAANFLVGVVKVLGTTFNILGTALGLVFRFFNNIVEYVVSDVVPAFQSIGRGIGNFIEASQRLPIIGTLIRGLVATVTLLRDAIVSLPATMAGFRAAAQQAVENVKGSFTGLILSAKILAKELELALTIRSDAREKLSAEIVALKNQQAEAASVGRTIGQAYIEARNKALADGEAKAQEEEKKRAAARKVQDLSVGGETPEDAAARRKRLLDADLKEVEAGNLRREVVLENARLKDEVSEREYQNRLIGLKKQKLQEQLAVYRKFKQEESVEALKVQNELLRIEAETRRPSAGANFATLPGRGPGQVTSQADGTADAIERNRIGKDALLAALRNKFEAALIAEQDYNLQKLEIQRLALAEEIAILKSASQPQLDEIKKREEAKKKIEEKIGQERLENERRLEQLKQQALQEGTKALGDVFTVAADLLSQDEKRKQKHASVVKALQIANIQVNLAAEISGIYANAQKSAIAQLLGPVAGTVLASIQAAFAVVRAGIATGKIQAAKFSRGVLGFFGGKPHSQGGTKGYFDDGTMVEVEKDEAWAVVNKKNAPLLRLLSNINSLGGNGVPYFEKGAMLRFDTGGLPNVNTTPIPASPIGQAQIQDSGAVERIERAAMVMMEAARAFPRRVKADVVYTDIEDAGTELNAVRDDAAL